MRLKDVVIFHPTSKGWSWTQVSSASRRIAAIAPGNYDNRSNAKRAANIQAKKLGWDLPAIEDLDYVRE